MSNAFSDSVLAAANRLVSAAEGKETLASALDELRPLLQLLAVATAFPETLDVNLDHAEMEIMQDLTLELDEPTRLAISRFASSTGHSADSLVLGDRRGAMSVASRCAQLSTVLFDYGL